MAHYSFVTIWRFRAPIEQVWEHIARYQDWPSWWPAIQSARQVAPGDADGVGEVAELTFRTRLPYKLTFLIMTTRLQSPTELDGRAAGELEGIGRWRLTAEGDGTLVTYYWEVRTTRWWMNVLARIARPAFHWNHDQVMESGRAGLARRLAQPAPARSRARPLLRVGLWNVAASLFIRSRGWGAPQGGAGRVRQPGSSGIRTSWQLVPVSCHASMLQHGTHRQPGPRCTPEAGGVMRFGTDRPASMGLRRGGARRSRTH